MSNSLRYKYAPESERGDDWRTRANCRDEDPELFFPIGTSGTALEQIRRARKICRECPVIMECLENALQFRNQEGVAAGLTASERNTKRKAFAQGRLTKHALHTLIDEKLNDCKVLY